MDAVSTAFSALMGREPAGLWSAPGRVNLIGEHTDYNAGLALPIALPHRTYAACAPRGDDLLRVQSLQQDRGIEITIDQIAPDQPGGWAAYVAGVIWAMRAEGIAAPGLDVVVDGQVPLGAGLSSSAALECSVAAAAADLAGTDLMNSAQGRGLLAQCADRAENEIALAPTGGMDQLASMLCQRDHALLLDCRDGRTEQVPFDLGAHELALLVTDTRAEHALVDGQYAQRGAVASRQLADWEWHLCARFPGQSLRRRSPNSTTISFRDGPATSSPRSTGWSEPSRPWQPMTMKGLASSSWPRMPRCAMTTR